MSEIHENAAAYALVSLETGEMAEFETHLATCAFCQQEVAEFSESIAQLSLLTNATPPPNLRANVLAAIQNVPQLPGEPYAAYQRIDSPSHPPNTSPTKIRPAGPRRAQPGSWVPDVPDEVERPRVDEVQLRRQRRRSRILSGLVAALLITSVGLGGVIYTLVQQRQDEVAAKAVFEEQLLRAEDARVIVTPTLQGGGRCTFIVSRQLNRALYLGTNMPDPGPGRHYQLWTATGTESDNDPVLDNAVPNVRPWRQFFSGDVAQADLVVVSIELDGSTPDAPTSDQIVAQAELPS